MVKDIIKDDEILSKKCEKATIEDMDVVQDIIDTMDSLEDVACLAANQIGVTKAIGVYLDEDDNRFVMFNPVLRKALYPLRTVEECFSRDGETKVTRYGWIQVEFDEPQDGALIHCKREYQGRDAQVIHHLIDHCKGKLV